MRAPESSFQRYMSERILSFAYVMCPSVSGPKALKKMCRRFAIFNFSEKIQNIWEIGLNKYGMFVQKSLGRKIRGHIFVVYVLTYPLSKFGGNQTNSLWVFSFLQCPLQVKKLIRENCAKYVNQTGNFYLRPKVKTTTSLPIFNLFQWFNIHSFAAVGKKVISQHFAQIMNTHSNHLPYW